MKSKSYSWKSYVFIFVSVMVTTLIFLLDIIGRITEERLSGAVILLILIGDLVSIIMAIITFTTKYEKRLIPAIAIIFTVLNTGVIIFFLWFGSKFV